MEDLEIAVTKEVALGEFSLYQASVEPSVIFKLPNFMKYLDNTPSPSWQILCRLP